MHSLIPVRPGRSRIAAGAIAVTAALTVLLPTNTPAFADPFGGYEFRSAITLTDGITLSDAHYEFTPGAITQSAGPAAVSSSAEWAMGWTWYDTDAQTTMSAQIIDSGRASEYWVGITARSFLSGANSHQSGSCTIYRGNPQTTGVALDQDNSAPYACPQVDERSAQYLTEIRSGAKYEVTRMDFTLRTQAWSTVRTSIAPVGNVALDSGILQSTNTRFIADGVWFHGAGAAAQAPYLSIATGAKVQLSAFERNSEAGGASNFDFAYRIIDEATPTQFWIRGNAQNERGAWFHHTGDCTIFSGDPTLGGVATNTSPYLCEGTDDADSSNGDWRLTYTVSRAALVDLDSLRAAELLPRGCADAEAICTYVNRTHTVVTDPLTPLTGRVWNETGANLTKTYKYTVKREIENSFETSVAVKANILGLFKASVEQSYTHTNFDGVDVTDTEDAEIPGFAVGWLSEAPSRDVFTGDYIFLLDGVWYRALNATFSVPAKLGDVVFQCAPIADMPYGKDAKEDCQTIPPMSRDQAGPGDEIHGGGTEEALPPAENTPGDSGNTHGASGAAHSSVPGDAKALARTGGTDFALAMWAACGVMVSGLALLVRRRRTARS